MHDVKIAFLGLGVMGYPMAGHLQKAGYKVTVYNRTAEKAKKWAAEYAEEYAGKYDRHQARTPADAAKNADIVCACVGNDDDIRAITSGPDGAFYAMKEGAIFIDHTTASATVARELAAAAGDNLNI